MINALSLNNVPITPDNVLNEVCKFVQIDCPTLSSNTPEEKIKEICVARLCKDIGIRCAYNYKNDFFDFFASIIGEAIVNKLKINLTIDKFNLKYVKFKNVNLINTAQQLLDKNSKIGDAFIAVYDFTNEYKDVIYKLKKA